MRVHLPAALYENLPRLYAGLAILVLLGLESGLRWPLAALLAWGAVVVTRWRRRYRAAAGAPPTVRSDDDRYLIGS